MESYVKFAAGAALAVAALGVPAVYVQFSRLNVPATVPYDHALRAGLLPALVLTLTVWYLIHALRAYGTLADEPHTRLTLVVMALPAVPLLIAWGVLFGVGLFSVLLLASEPIVSGIAGLLGFSPARLERFLLSMGVLVIVGASWQLVALLVNRRDTRRATVVEQGESESGDLASHSQPEHGESREEPEGGTHGSRWDLRLWMSAGARFVLVIPAVTILLALASRAVLHRWGWAVTWFDTELILVFCAITVIAWSLAGSVLLFGSMSERESDRRQWLIFQVGFLGIAYIATVLLYAYSVYPYLPQSFGGGRPVPVIVWAAPEDIPRDVARDLPRSQMTASDDAVRIEGVFVVYSNSSFVILTDTELPPGDSVLIPRGSVKALGSGG